MFFSILKMIIMLAPTFLLCLYVYHRDRVEKEPAGLLLLLFLAGAVAFIPSFFIDNGILDLLGSLFSGKISYSNEGMIICDSTNTMILILYRLGRSFLANSFVDELFKWGVLIALTAKNKNFNSLFDGIIYSVCVSFGYAVSDSIAYMLGGGKDLFLLRTVEYLPSQIFFGLLMGVFYTLWHAYSLAHKQEKKMLEEGTLLKQKVSSGTLLLLLSLIAPVAVNTVFSLAGTEYEDISIRIAYSSLVIIFYVFFFVIIERFSKRDTGDYMAAQRIIMKKHPEYTDDKGEQL